MHGFSLPVAYPDCKNSWRPFSHRGWTTDSPHTGQTGNVRVYQGIDAPMPLSSRAAKVAGYPILRF